MKFGVEGTMENYFAANCCLTENACYEWAIFESALRTNREQVLSSTFDTMENVILQLSLVTMENYVYDLCLREDYRDQDVFGETIEKVVWFEDSERVSVHFAVEFENEVGKKNKDPFTIVFPAMKVTLNDSDGIKPIRLRFSTTESDQDPGSHNLRSLDYSTNRYLIKVSNFAKILIFLVSFSFTPTGANTEATNSAPKFAVTIGYSVRLECSSGEPILWTHLQIGMDHPNDVYADDDGLIGPYKMLGRHRVENGTKNLLLTNMTTDDAGTYTCVDKETLKDIFVVYLVAAVSNLVWSMNPNWNDIVGENDCGIRPDTIRFNCSIRYFGNFPPTLQWRNSGQQDVITNGVETSTAHGYSTSVLSVPARWALNGTQFDCRLNESQSNDNQLTWGFPPLNIQYFFNSSETIEVSKDVEPRCSANSSQLCDYQWINDDQERYVTIIKDSIFKPHEDVTREGTYHCRAECRIRDTTCVAIPFRTKNIVPELPGKNGNVQYSCSKLGLAIITSILIIISIVLGILVLYIKCRGKCSTGTTDDPTSIQLMPSRSEVISLIPRDVPKSYEVTGLTFFQNKIYIVCFNSNLVLIHSDKDICTEKEDEIRIDDMECPWDIVSSEVNQSLYISDKSCQSVWTIHMPDKKTSQWAIDGQPRGMSTTQDGVLLLVVFWDSKQCYILETIRPADGRRTTISLPADMDDAWQAVQLSNRNFAISHLYKDQHSISELSNNGKAIRRFNVGLQEPIDLFTTRSPNDREDDIFVVSPTLDRVICFNSDEKHIQLVFNHHFERSAMRFYLIEQMKRDLDGHWLKLPPISAYSSRDDWIKFSL